MPLLNAVAAKVSLFPEEVTMTCNKPEHIKDESWDQHLRWLDLVSKECKTNHLKRRRENAEHGEYSA